VQILALAFLGVCDVGVENLQAGDYSLPDLVLLDCLVVPGEELGAREVYDDAAQHTADLSVGTDGDLLGLLSYGVDTGAELVKVKAWE